MEKKPRALYEEKKQKEKLKLLFALVDKSRRGDKQLAKLLGMSHSTTIRRRQELEKEGYIKDYTAIPDFKKIGIEIVGFHFGLASTKMRAPEVMTMVRQWLKGQPEVICMLDGQGLGSNFLLISVHKNYESYAKFIENMRAEPGAFPAIPNIQSFIVSTAKAEVFPKPFSLRQIESLILPPEAQAHKNRSKP